MNKEFFDFSVKATRTNEGITVGIYNNSTAIFHEVNLERTVDAVKIPDIFCMLLKNYQKKFEGQNEILLAQTEA